MHKVLNNLSRLCDLIHCNIGLGRKGKRIELLHINNDQNGLLGILIEDLVDLNIIRLEF